MVYPYYVNQCLLINILGECIALWGKRKQVLLCGRCCCTFVCKWYNSKRAGLCRLRNPQSLEDPQSSQAAPAVLSRLQQSFFAGAAEEQPTCQGVGTLSQTRIAGFDALAVALICYVAGEDSLAVLARCCARLRSLQSAIVSGWVGQEYGSLLKYADA